MKESVCIFDFYPENKELLALLNVLKGEHKLLFALTDYWIENVEGYLKHTIDNQLVAITEPDESYNLIYAKNTFKWFSTSSDEDVLACLETNRYFYMGAIVDEDHLLAEPVFTFEFCENLTVGEECESALFMGCPSGAELKMILDKIGVYKMLKDDEGHSFWLPVASEFWNEDMKLDL